MDDALEVVDELGPQRLVETVLRGEGLALLLGCRLGQVEVGGVAGEPGEQEDAEQHDDQRQCAGVHPAPDEGKHGLSLQAF